MLVSDLLAYDLVPSELAALKAAMPERLLPLQTLAVQHGLLGEEDLVIVGPAGSGKSTLATLLTVHAEHLGQRVLSLRPEADLQTLRRLILQPEQPDAAPELFAADLILIDELEALRDTEVEGLLSRLLQRVQLLKERRDGGPRLVAFSAPLDGVTALATRLRARIVESAAIPPEPGRLIGTLCDGRASFAGLAAPAQRLQEDLCLPARATFFEMLTELGRRGPTLLLAPDEASCVRLTNRLASRPIDDFPSALRAAGELRRTAPGRAQALLSDSLRHGVAFYGPSLSPRQQAIVEGGHRSGEVRLIVAPIGEASRLLQAGAAFQSVVVYARWRWQRDAQSGRFAQVALDRLELSRLGQLCRRASFAPFGPVLVYARSPIESEEIWRQQIEAPPRPLPTRSSQPSQSDPPREPAEQVWRRWAQSSADLAISSLELLCVTALGPFALPLPLLLSEQPGADYGTRLAERMAALKLAERPFFGALRSFGGPFDHETLRAVKRGLLLLDWVDGASGPAIEDTYHVFVGLIGRIAADSADRLDALRSVCAAVGWSDAAQRPLGDLAARLRARPIDSIADPIADSIGDRIGESTGNYGSARAEAVVDEIKADPTPRSLNTLVGALRAKKVAAEAVAARSAVRTVVPFTRERRR